MRSRDAAVSLGLGVVALGLALALPLPSAVDGVVFWLGQINLTLLVFNLLPALPLDGGRVLRALLWARRGDLRSATRTAGALGRGFGRLLIGFGLLTVLIEDPFAGAWLAFIGWFILLAARAEGQLAETQAGLHGLRVRDLMVAHPVTVPPELPLDRFMIDVFERHRHTAYPVARPGGPPLGLISFERVLEEPRVLWARERVQDCMAPLGTSTVLDADAPLEDALAVLAGGPIGRALVRDVGGFGLLSMTDVTRVVESRAGAR